MMWILVATGGGLGALLRYLVYFICNRYSLFFVLPTILVNVIGSFIVGIVFYFVVTNEQFSEYYKSFIITGILGGFTTFSLFSLDCFRMLQSELYFQSIVYCIISVMACVLCTFLGYAIFYWLNLK